MALIDGAIDGLVIDVSGFWNFLQGQVASLLSSLLTLVTRNIAWIHFAITVQSNRLAKTLKNIFLLAFFVFVYLFENLSYGEEKMEYKKEKKLNTIRVANI